MRTAVSEVREFRRALVHETPQAIVRTNLGRFEEMLDVSEDAVGGLEELLNEKQDESDKIV